MGKAIALLAILSVAGIGFIGIQIVRGQGRVALISSIVFGIFLLFYNSYLEEETGRGIARHLYCATFSCHLADSAKPGIGVGPAVPLAAPEPAYTPPPPSPPPPSPYEGIYGSDFGPVRIRADGGSFADGAGQLSGALAGSGMSGHWSRPPALFIRNCGSGRPEGDFRFDFTAAGFTGRWSYCGEPLKETWSGWRPKIFRYRNTCPYPVRVTLKWRDATGAWKAAGAWDVPGYQPLDLIDAEGDSSGTPPMRTTAAQAYAWVTRADTGAIVLQGSEQVVIGDRSYAMAVISGVHGEDLLVFAPQCPGQSSAM